MRYSNPFKPVFLVLGILLFVVLSVHPTKGASDPSTMGPCAVGSQEVEIETAKATVFYPQAEACADFAQEPYAAIAFAHGFSMFGLSDGVSENQANGEHLASWGYVVAIPALPDDAEERVSLLIDTLDFLESANVDAGSVLKDKVDTNRLTTAGYSLGGATALATAARDSRVTAVVALDPVYHTGNFGGEGDPIWDPAKEAPKIKVPAGILGAPPSSCNAQADYADIYPLVGSAHKGSYLITGASHCVFADPGTSFCRFFCGGGTTPELTTASKKYMTAWFNYYVQLKPEYYDYLFGDQVQKDSDEGLIQYAAHTAARNLKARASSGAVQLSWNTYQHPIVTGYKVYRRLQADQEFGPPFASVDLSGSYLDFSVTGGQTYVYTVGSFDTAGNIHQPSAPATIMVEPDSEAKLIHFLPMIRGS